MEYIADSPLLVHNAKFDIRIGISLVPSAARYQSPLGERGEGGGSVLQDRIAKVVSYYHLSSQPYPFKRLFAISIL